MHSYICDSPVCLGKKKMRMTYAEKMLVNDMRNAIENETPVCVPLDIVV